MSNKALERYRRIRLGYVRAGKTFSEVARRAGVSATLVTLVAQGRRRNEKVQRLLALNLGKTHKELWK